MAMGNSCLQQTWYEPWSKLPQALAGLGQYSHFVVPDPTEQHLFFLPHRYQHPVAKLFDHRHGLSTWQAYDHRCFRIRSPANREGNTRHANAWLFAIEFAHERTMPGPQRDELWRMPKWRSSTETCAFALSRWFG